MNSTFDFTGGVADLAQLFTAADVNWRARRGQLQRSRRTEQARIDAAVEAAMADEKPKVRRRVCKRISCIHSIHVQSLRK